MAPPVRASRRPTRAARRPPLAARAQTDDFRVRQQRALAAWVSKQRTYCQGLLTPAATEGVASLLESLPGPDKAELVELLRTLHAVAQPQRYMRAARPRRPGPLAPAAAGRVALMWRRPRPAAHLPPAARRAPRRSQPLSHELHCKQYSVEDAATTALLKEQTRAKCARARRAAAAPPAPPARPPARPAREAGLAGTRTRGASCRARRSLVLYSECARARACTRRTMGARRQPEVRGFRHAAAAAGAAAGLEGGAAAAAAGGSGGGGPRQRGQPKHEARAGDLVETLRSR